MKRCSSCGKLKKESEFPKDRTRKDGLHQRCKACKNAYSRQHYKKRQDARSTGSGQNRTKQCSGCGKQKPVSEFSKDRTKKDGLYHLCKTCRSEYRRNKKKLAETGPEGRPGSAGGDPDGRDIGMLAIVYTGVECGACSLCGKSLIGYIPGYLHGQPVCRDCVIINLKAMYHKKTGGEIGTTKG
ncbi:MAG: hypothetical protein DRH37_01045 [Deltaproteobacteria bacterium]|nr:MAG: hypothetical protein DRH37_01045 [Deltaproteobacteria bacterium]